MENQDKKKQQPVIDEARLMSIMAGDETATPSSIEPETTREPTAEKPAVKERGRIRKNSEVDYEKQFFKNSGTAARNGKSVYIRPEFHERLSRIVQVIGEDKLTIYAYLDNLLEYHFQEFGEDITKSFNNKYKPIL
ncbi:DUF3408 domain-containing protein [Chitinophaga sp. GbtcB8]|uniref:DUF3408 domain-containing protein n=1 Tax=Chitinophaga sp. GbtcB8 TaxID=2824753 RepID=UPI001C303B7C|nr:DUF3408 domain-containing protein [Chitinophaga sp. GbtcB8]